MGMHKQRAAAAAAKDIRERVILMNAKLPEGRLHREASLHVFFFLLMKKKRIEKFQKQV